VFVAVEIIRDLVGAPFAQDAGWNPGLEKMLEFAGGRGWEDSTGAVRAHVLPRSVRRVR
jgi:hypothetical protein